MKAGSVVPLFLKPYNPFFQQRDAIRKTWGFHRRSVQVVFIVGVARDVAAVNAALQDEMRTNTDILHVDLIDSYRNNTLKVIFISYLMIRAHLCFLL